MNTLQFIDSMTGRLAWPVTVIVLGLVFRNSLVQLLSRVRKLRWREAEAEIAEATKKAEEVVEKRAQPLVDKVGDAEQVEGLVQDAARWGALSALNVDLWPLAVPGPAGAGKGAATASIASRMLRDLEAFPKLYFPLHGHMRDVHDDDDDDPPLMGAPTP